ncbi:hypothetical protein Pint_20648 [Pistacia integerrima]|uniref:Uncharacterized protein n=1 Tax=Pistacia integerrima TaxID=434235 RepID=A0ACC0XCH4_9ROSI|nr:hypothetical protein Pint_20648 [Pistacia integerrima]
MVLSQWHMSTVNQIQWYCGSKNKNLECHYCGKPGHIKKYYYKWKRKNKHENSKHEKNDDGKQNDQVATVTSEDFFILYDDDVVNVASQETSWVIDSGASIHATSRNDLFTCYAASDFGTIKIGNDDLMMRAIAILLVMINGSSLGVPWLWLDDPVEKKLARSRDVVFMKDQTIQDVEKTEKVVP